MKMDVFEGLWEIEQQLISCIDEIRTIARTVEGARKIVWNEADKSERYSAFPNQIILSGLDNGFTLPTVLNNRRFMGGSLSSRISYAEGLPCAQANVVKNNITDDERLLTLFASRNKQKLPNNQQSSCTQLKTLQQKAHVLSCQIFQKRQEMGLKMWMCDQVSAKDIDIKMGGDGNFKDANGNVMIMPDIPLSKTCLGRRGNINDSLWIMECVLCPVNYTDTDQRFIAWQEHFNVRKDTIMQTNQQSNIQRISI